MKIRHYLFNAFVIESGKTKIAIDPGHDTPHSLPPMSYQNQNGLIETGLFRLCYHSP